MDAHVVTLTSDELWAVRDFVRQHDRLGQEWDKDFERRLFSAMAVAKEDINRQAPFTFESEDELWQITRQIPSTLMVGTQQVGRLLLEKVQAAILAWVPAESHDDDGPAKGPLPSCMDAWNAELDERNRKFNAGEY